MAQVKFGSAWDMYMCKWCSNMKKVAKNSLHLEFCVHWWYLYINPGGMGGLGNIIDVELWPRNLWSTRDAIGVTSILLCEQNSSVIIRIAFSVWTYKHCKLKVGLMLCGFRIIKHWWRWVPFTPFQMYWIHRYHYECWMLLYEYMPSSLLSLFKTTDLARRREKSG